MKRNIQRVMVIFSLVVTFFTTGSRAEPVYPEIAEKAGTLELGEAILLLMPNEGTSAIEWSHNADGPIVWITDGIKTKQSRNGQMYAEREGVLRIHVLGKFAHVLRQRINILAWTVIYSTSGNPKFGVEKISLFPGASGDQCFGTLFDGCEFDLLPSLEKAGLFVKKICENKEFPGSGIVAYRITYPHKRGTNIILTHSSGSGGASSWIDMDFGETSPMSCV